MVLKFLLQLVFYSMCLCGFLYQAITTSVTFFSFKTTTRISLHVRDPVLIPDYAICVRYTDLMLDDKFVDTTEAVMAFATQHTIADFFADSPSTNDIIGSCMIRNPNSYTIREANKTVCYEHFEVTKYVFNELLCYELHYKNQSHVFKNLQIFRSLLFSGKLYLISLNRTSVFNRVAYLKTSSYYPGDWIQYQSLELAQDTWTRRSEGSRFNYYVTTFQMFVTINLEAPYETNCHDYSTSSQEMCVMNCLLDRSVKEVNAVPSQVIVSHPISLKHIDERNESLSKFVDRIVEECKSRYCSKRDCERTHTLSTTSKNMKLNAESFSFVVAGSNAPDTIIESGPFLILTDYVLFILSLAGSWFGVSVLGLNPFKLFDRFRPKNRNVSQSGLPNAATTQKMLTAIQRFNTTFYQHNSRIKNLEKKILRRGRN